MANKYYGGVYYVIVCLFEIYMYGHICNDTGTRGIIYSPCYISTLSVSVWSGWWGGFKGFLQ